MKVIGVVYAIGEKYTKSKGGEGQDVILLDDDGINKEPQFLELALDTFDKVPTLGDSVSFYGRIMFVRGSSVRFAVSGKVAVTAPTKN